MSNFKIFQFSGGAESGETDSREELQRLYAQLENWRLSEEKRIMTTTRQASRLRSARAKLVTDEALKLAQLANKRDKNKLAHKQDIVRSIILKVHTMKIKFITLILIYIIIAHKPTVTRLTFCIISLI